MSGSGTLFPVPLAGPINRLPSECPWGFQMPAWSQPFPRVSQTNTHWGAAGTQDRSGALSTVLTPHPAIHPPALPRVGPRGHQGPAPRTPQCRRAGQLLFAATRATAPPSPAPAPLCCSCGLSSRPCPPGPLPPVTVLLTLSDQLSGRSFGSCKCTYARCCHLSGGFC